MARLVTDRVDLKLDPQTWDLVFENGDLAFSTGVEAVGQAIRFKLQLLQGEWFLDETAGTPWFQNVLGQKFGLDLMRSLFYGLVISVDEVERIERLGVEFDSATRGVFVSYIVVTTFGDTLAGSVALGVAL